ncbi:MAG: FtsX-like permease family protein, partial [Bryobacteraceae bacterium]
ASVTPDYFRILRIPILRGRAFTERDTGNAPSVVVISDAMARTHFAGQDPLGRRLHLEDSPGEWREIVGVAGDVRQNGLDRAVDPAVYRPLEQKTRNFASLVVRLREGGVASSASVRAEAQAADAEQPFSGVETMDQVVADSLAPRRYPMLLMGLFAALALALAVVGIYGVMSYSIAQRTQEIGVRMALGATPRDVLRMVLVQGATLAAAGVAAGVVASAALSRFLSGMLYGVGGLDPVTYAAVSLVLALVALAACWIPARKATRVDPIAALRHE